MNYKIIKTSGKPTMNYKIVKSSGILTMFYVENSSGDRVAGPFSTESQARTWIAAVETIMQAFTSPRGKPNV